ncbi:DUF3108 domain-containing protein [Suttonella sp. R2A3]|uniref:DUF3108 domain-containing protein n=1 Tax=Suttonella sp. R2A3 TaxID=2908648 RepID=UPI001F440AFB|nr:DUF3108 domain-containing protein [Suttonella sp. R2A3]UJF24390.1 DUF3108 domain-containing protein [Suttonella sp. R2A3]
MREIDCMGRYKLLTALLCCLSSAGFALGNYSAMYDVSVRGVGAGQMRHDVILTDNTYRIDTVAKPSLAAKMLGFGVIRESVKGLLNNGKIQPQRYQRSMEGDAEYRLVYDFRPNRHEIAAQIGNEETILKYDEGSHPLDTLSLVIQSLLDDENNQLAAKYVLVSEDKVRSYSVEEMPHEKWEDPSGAVIDVRVFRQVSGNRQTQIYFADNPLRLVKLTQIKDDKPRFHLKLIDYRAL